MYGPVLNLGGEGGGGAVPVGTLISYSFLIIQCFLRIPLKFGHAIATLTKILFWSVGIHSTKTWHKINSVEIIYSLYHFLTMNTNNFLIFVYSFDRGNAILMMIPMVIFIMKKFKINIICFPDITLQRVL